MSDYPNVTVMEETGSRGDRLSCCSSYSPTVKIAGLWKRSQGLRRFTKPNYRHRVFILTDQALSYYAGTLDRIGNIKGRIPIECIKAVEFVDNGAFSLAHTMQVIYQTKKHGFVTLYVTGRDREECTDWVSSIRQACYFNQDMLMHYHPGSYTKTRWSCCQQRTRQSLGCQPTYYLLTRSSSRYAEMRRNQRLSRRNQVRPYSAPHRATMDVVPYINEETTPIHQGSGRSTSCDNILSISRDVNPLSNFANTHAVSSCYTLITLAEMTTPSAEGENTIISTRRSSETDAGGSQNQIVQEYNRDLPLTSRHGSETNSRGSHQVAPECSTDVPLAQTFPKHRLNSCPEVTPPPEATPPTVKKKLFLPGGSRSSSISDQDFLSLPRKASIEPRVSDTNPELIHV